MKKISGILKLTLAVCLAVGTMLAMIACVANNSQESSSGTGISEATTTAPTIVEDPKLRIERKKALIIENINSFFDKYSEQFKDEEDTKDIVEGDKFIYLAREEDSENSQTYSLGVSGSNFDKKISIIIQQMKISNEQYNYFVETFNVADDKSEPYLNYPIIRFSNDYSGELSMVLEITKNINEIEDEKVLDIILDSFSKSLSQEQ